MYLKSKTWFHIHIYCRMITKIKVISTIQQLKQWTSFHRLKRSMFETVCMWRECFRLLSNFQVHNTILLTMITLLFVRSSELDLITESWSLSPTSPHPPDPAPGNHCSTPRLWNRLLLILHISDTIQYSSLCLTSFTEQTILQVCLCCHKWRDCLLYMAE